MTVFFTAVVIIDGWLDGSLTAAAANKPVQGTIFCILVSLLAIPAQLELSKLAALKNLKIYLPVTIIASILVATYWYWQQFTKIPNEIYRRNNMLKSRINRGY